MSTEITDYAPVGIVDDRDILFTTLRSGEPAATLSAIDTGPLTGGRWIIDAQSHAGLFSIAYDPAVDTAARLLVSDAAKLPEAGAGVSVTVHYYDRYQLDGNGMPLAGKGIAETLVYMVEAGTSRELDGFGADLRLGSAAQGSSPALASLAGDAFVAAWQAPGGSLWAQVRDAAGAPAGAAFQFAGAGAGPSVAALADGRFVLAYTGADGRIAWRVAGADGSLGPAFQAGAPGGDTAMADLAVLADGAIAIAWRGSGQVHVQRVDAAGQALGAEQVFGTLGSAFSPSLTALGSGYAVAWGEIGDGNVYAALPGGATVQVTRDGMAASLTTAAPLPDIVQLRDGSFVVAWDSYGPFGFTISDIFFQRFDAAGNALGGITQVNVDSGSGRFGAKLSAQDDGGFMLAWQAQGGDFDANGVFGRRFAQDGAAMDAREFGINEGRAGDQAGPALAALAHGGFAAAWIDTQESGASQVEARVLAGTPPPAPSTGSGASSGASGSQAPADPGSVTAPPPVEAPPVAPEPVPVPEPVVPAPAPEAVIPVPAPVLPIPAPVVPAPAPVAPAPAPVTPAPVPVVPSPAVPKPPPVANPAPPAVPVVPKTELLGQAGADLIRAGADTGNQRIDALDGLDTVSYGGVRSAFTLLRGLDGITVAGKGGASDLLVNVERVAFADAAVAFDIDGVAGQAYRLYTAAFDRAPDKAGLGYWIGMLDAGLALTQVAGAFAGSSEFASLYGAHASDERFVELLYDNVLHRAAEGAGRQFWVDALSTHGVSRAEVLAHFSESVENQAQVIGVVQNGIDYLPWA